MKIQVLDQVGPTISHMRKESGQTDLLVFGSMTTIVNHDGKRLTDLVHDCMKVGT